MCIIFDSLPAGLNLDGIRPANPHPWTRGDQTVISSDGQSFAAAFDIVEMTMMNEMAGVVWGSYGAAGAQIYGYLPAWSISCSSRPFCAWVTPQVFIVKLPHETRGWQLLAIHIKLGFQIVGESALDTRPSDISPQDIPKDGWSGVAPFMHD